MTISLSKNVPFLMAITLGMVSMIAPVDAQTSSTICTSKSPQCCWVKRSWELMGKTTSVNAESATDCCYYLGAATKTWGITGLTWIPGVHCTLTGNVTRLDWYGKSLQNFIPTELGNLRNLKEL